MNPDLAEVLDRLRRYAYARHRDTDREPRSIVITDDEAALIVEALSEMV